MLCLCTIFLYSIVKINLPMLYRICVSSQHKRVRSHLALDGKSMSTPKVPFYLYFSKSNKHLYRTLAH